MRVIISNQKEYKDLIAFDPGPYIEDIIEDLNITQEEFSNKLSVSFKTINQLVKGEIKLSSNIAYKLEALTKIDHQTWMNLQKSYDKKIKK